MKILSIYTVFLFIVATIVLNSCSPKKYFTTDDTLLTKTTVECNTKQVDVSDIEDYIRQKPVRLIFGFALHARIYNSVDPVKTDERRAKIQKILDEKNDLLRIKHENKISKYRTRARLYPVDSRKYNKYIEKSKHLRNKGYAEKTKRFSFPIFLQKIGEEPVKYDARQSAKSADQIRLYMNNKGFYHAKVSFTETTRHRNTHVVYAIDAGKPLIVKDILYNIAEDTLRHYVMIDTTTSLIKCGNILDVDQLRAESDRITLNLKNYGYYHFSKNYISYQIDTIGLGDNAKLTIQIDPIILENNITINHRRLYISQITVYPNHDSKSALVNEDDYYNDTDTSLYLAQGHSLYFVSHANNTKPVRPFVISNEIFIQPHNLYRQIDVTNTYRHLSAFNVYKLVNIEFTPAPSRDSINCNIYLTHNMLQAYIFEIGGTNSSGNLGAASSFTYQHKNIFHGAETFDMKLSLALESQNNLGKEQLKLHLNTQEYGLETRIYFPRLLNLNFLRDFFRDNTPRTYFSVGVNYRIRPDYTRSMLNANFYYQWQVGDYFVHTFTPLRLSSIHISNTDSTFMRWLEKLYIKDSYQDHFILGSTYSISFNNQSSGHRNYDFVKLNVSWAGNILQFINNKAHSTKNELGAYTVPFFNTMYAQFIKADIDLRHYIKTSQHTTMALRGYCGVGFPYGNSVSMPFTEQYFSGGSNSLRAWQIRSVGPGSYSVLNDAETQMQKQFPNMTSDMKLEGNLECRFKLFWVIEGAWFVDAGNIWSIKADDRRTGGNFEFNRFYKEIAVGTGLGIRLDFDFFIFRTDFGLKLHDPSLPDGSRWLISNDKQFMFRKSNWAFGLGIGYPF